jgi:glycosyltransferase involved in cell wall biosynthesis
LIKISGLQPGLSLKKIVCDVHMFFKFISLMIKNCYDVVHAVEESVFMALVVCPLRSIPFIYDMDSSMTTQIVAKHPMLKPVKGILNFIESIPIRYATVVVPMCDALAEDAARAGAKNIVVLKDVSLMGEAIAGVARIRDELGLTGSIVMYIGNLERYQGIDLMLESFAIVRRQDQDVSLVIIGGNTSHIEEYHCLAESLGISDQVHFLGKKPVAHIGEYMAQADILLSPRTEGVNTPMKIYSYLHSGTTVLATDLPTHTQVMTPKIAMLAAPDKLDFAAAMLELLEDHDLRTRLANKAREYIDREHSYPVFEARVNDLYTQLEQRR